MIQMKTKVKYLGVDCTSFDSNLEKSSGAVEKTILKQSRPSWPGLSNKMVPLA